MRCSRCGTCCQQTDMLLSEADIARLEAQGHLRTSFVRFDQDGYAFLRNRQGHCVFYNEKEQRCNVYEFRPEGCKVYPVMFNEEAGIVIDSICPAKCTISEEEKQQKGKIVISILKTIDQETLKRRCK